MKGDNLIYSISLSEKKLKRQKSKLKKIVIIFNLKLNDQNEKSTYFILSLLLFTHFFFQRFKFIFIQESRNSKKKDFLNLTLQARFSELSTIEQIFSSYSKKIEGKKIMGAIKSKTKKQEEKNTNVEPDVNEGIYDFDFSSPLTDDEITKKINTENTDTPASNVLQKIAENGKKYNDHVCEVFFSFFIFLLSFFRIINFNNNKHLSPFHYCYFCVFSYQF